MKKMVVKKFSSVIGVEAEESERQLVLDFLECLFDTFIAFIPYSPIFGPTAENISQGKGPDEVALNGISSMGYGVGMQDARSVYIGVIGLNGNLMFQPGTGPGSATSFAAVDSSGRLQQSINGGRADSQHFLRHFSADFMSLPIVGHPNR